MFDGICSYWNQYRCTYFSRKYQQLSNYVFHPITVWLTGQTQRPLLLNSANKPYLSDYLHGECPCPSPVECNYNTIRYGMTLHMALQRQNMKQSFNSQKTSSDSMNLKKCYLCIAAVHCSYSREPRARIMPVLSCQLIRVLLLCRLISKWFSISIISFINYIFTDVSRSVWIFMIWNTFSLIRYDSKWTTTGFWEMSQ